MEKKKKKERSKEERTINYDISHKGSKISFGVSAQEKDSLERYSNSFLLLILLLCFFILSTIFNQCSFIIRVLQLLLGLI